MDETRTDQDSLAGFDFCRRLAGNFEDAFAFVQVGQRVKFKVTQLMFGIDRPAAGIGIEDIHAGVVKGIGIEAGTGVAGKIFPGEFRIFFNRVAFLLHRNPVRGSGPFVLANYNTAGEVLPL